LKMGQKLVLKQCGGCGVPDYINVAFCRRCETVWKEDVRAGLHHQNRIGMYHEYKANNTDYISFTDFLEKLKTRKKEMELL